MRTPRPWRAASPAWRGPDSSGAPSPTDRRAVIIEATEASLALRTKVADAWAELERLTIASLSETQQRTWP
ncbi:hypothetical protein GCM10017772_03510 [Promicromonospora soli]|uniref:Uncharacterized protein n=1 Tax=Promicromonospora soli TaxID=2035533 RepID=A0A919FI11_9MICO|nr:hypothetical protein GCM10017772_03510 [Promicromonospora soli]